MNRPETVAERRAMWLGRQFDRETEKERFLIRMITIERLKKENEELRKELSLLNG